MDKSKEWKRWWGLQDIGTGLWLIAGDRAGTLEEATLYPTPRKAFMMEGWRPTSASCSIREVLVSLADEWESLGWVGADARDVQGADGYVVAVKHDADVGCDEWYYTISAGASLRDKRRTVVHATKKGALLALVEYCDLNRSWGKDTSTVQVHAIRYNRQREVRVAGRTLGDILATVAVEVPSDA